MLSSLNYSRLNHFNHWEGSDFPNGRWPSSAFCTRSPGGDVTYGPRVSDCPPARLRRRTDWEKVTGPSQALAGPPGATGRRHAGMEPSSGGHCQVPNSAASLSLFFAWQLYRTHVSVRSS